MSKALYKIVAGLGVVSGLFVAALPLSSYAAQVSDTATVDINVRVADVATITSATSPVTINFATGQFGTTRSADCTVSVSTNSLTGYNLSLSMIPSDSAAGALVSGGDEIARSSNTFAAPGELTAGTWGYRITTFGADSYAGVPASSSAQQIKTTGGVSTNDTTVVTFGAKVAVTQPAGNYTNTVRFVATTN